MSMVNCVKCAEPIDTDWNVECYCVDVIVDDKPKTIDIEPHCDCCKEKYYGEIMQ